MKKKEWNEGLDHLDADLIEAYVSKKDQLRQKNKRAHGIWLRVGAIAACFVLVLSTALAVPLWRGNHTPPATSGDGTSSLIPIYRDPTSGDGTSSLIPIYRDPTSGDPSCGPLYYGSSSSINASVDGSGAVVYQGGISVTARVVETLPDTYTFFNDWKQAEFRLLKMELITVFYGKNVPNEFLFLIPVDYMTDYSRFDILAFFDMSQYTYEYFLCYNKTKNEVAQFHTVIFGYSRLSSDLGPNVKAFYSNKQFDMRLWESTEAWKRKTKSTVEYRGLEYYQSYTLQDAQDDIIWKNNHSVNFLDSLTGEAAETLAYVQSLSNGIYVPSRHASAHLLDPKVQFQFTRYIDSFATNEAGSIISNQVYWSKARFSKEDEQHLPNLRQAMCDLSRAYDEGKILPPNFEFVKGSILSDYGIFGWYAKTNDGIIGVIRVTWSYINHDLTRFPDDIYCDDAYYVIEYGSDKYVPIDRDALLDKMGNYETTYIYTGYYDRYGKVRKLSGDIA